MRSLGVQHRRRGSPGSDGRSLGTDKEGDESRVPMVLSKVLPISRLDLFSVWFTPKGSTLRRLSLGFSRPRNLVGETRSTGNRTPNSFMTTRTSFCFSRERTRAQREACPVRVESVSSSEQSRVRRELPTPGFLLKEKRRVNPGPHAPGPALLKEHVGSRLGPFMAPKPGEECYEILVTALSPSLLPSISIFSPFQRRKYQPSLPWTISLTSHTSSRDFSQGQ